ncbi:MAG: MgtC/SapB family protein [Candidatus Omnitrophica bacterium]|nr:MgtC/SapB family protein [Candidatus Omnitrophota bacterium]
MVIFEVIFKIALSITLCSLIGIERGLRHKGAGLRTHLLVGVGSTLIVINSLHLYNAFRGDIVIDPTRMIAGLITGIGFLCGGTIIRGGDQITGLTTAASLWIVSCIGIAVGSGDYAAAVIVTFVVLIILTQARGIEKIVEQKIREMSKGEEDDGIKG